jgi:hypothetical protein
MLAVGPMNRGIHLLVVLIVSSLLPSCWRDNPDGPEPAPEPDASPPPPDAAPPAECIGVDVRARKTVVVSGTVVDFATGAPVAGATVDITTGWDTPVPAFPSPECPLIATLTSGPDGTFGPATVLAGSVLDPSIMLFMVHGADRANTASDNRTCPDTTCTLDHTIAAPSATLAATWRTELAAGGMTDAATNGLIAYLYKNSDGSPAAGVTAQLVDVFPAAMHDLTVGGQVRYLADNRTTVTGTSQRTTTTGGVALIGFEAVESSSFIAGRRSADTWEPTGCFDEPGWIFLEDRTVSP